MSAYGDHKKYSFDLYGNISISVIGGVARIDNPVDPAMAEERVRQLRHYSTTPLKTLFDDFGGEVAQPLLYRSMKLARQCLRAQGVDEIELVRPGVNEKFALETSQQLRHAKRVFIEEIVRHVGGNPQQIIEKLGPADELVALREQACSWKLDQLIQDAPRKGVRNPGPVVLVN